MKKIIEFFWSNNNKMLMENLEKYEQKEKIKQQKSKILGQKQVNRKTNKRKETVLHG
tara:strand:+ start:779 stop:949 length:171 start_codon:yes stop_codon:yes gene_type:complete